MKQKNTRTTELVQLALFAAIILVMTFANIGYIPIPFLGINATIIHVPVILASVLFGPKKGAGMGFLFGLTSLVNNTIKPVATSFVFSPVLSFSLGGIPAALSSLVICFLPRILVGVTPWLVVAAARRLGKNGGGVLSLGIAGVVGAMTNTLLVMHGIYFLFGETYAGALGKSVEVIYAFILSIIAFNGVIEAIVAALLTAALGKALLRFAARDAA